jgi:hypothetical protein
MTGGYVKYIGAEASLLNKKVPSGSGKSYSFPNGKYILVSDEVDYKWFVFKAKANPFDWVAKVRLAEGEDVFGSDRPKPDPNDPQWIIERDRRRIADDFAKQKEHFRQIRGHLLPEELKAMKKIVEED